MRHPDQTPNPRPHARHPYFAECEVLKSALALEISSKNLGFHARHPHQLASRGLLTSYFSPLLTSYVLLLLTSCFCLLLTSFFCLLLTSYFRLVLTSYLLRLTADLKVVIALVAFMALYGCLLLASAYFSLLSSACFLLLTSA